MRQLIQADVQVIALLRPGADRARLAEVADRIEVVECDLLDPRLAEHLDRLRPQVCYHLAWYAVPGDYLRSQENLRSLRASLELAACLAERGCRKFVGVGTCVEYRSAPAALGEESATGPRTIYAASKLAVRVVLEQLATAAGMRWAWARLFHLYGPMEDPRRLVASVIRALLQGEPVATTRGTQVRDFLHVDDVAAALARVGERADGVVNIGSGVPVAVSDVVAQIGEQIGRVDLLRIGARGSASDEDPFICADVTRLASTGWHPGYNLGTGLTDTIAWWRQQLKPTKGDRHP